MRLRISGLVREATRAEEALRHGIAPAGRDAFLARVRTTVGEVERLLDGNALAADDLPPRSREALLLLRHVAALEPRDLPDVQPGAPPAPPRARLRNVVAALDPCLVGLEDGRADEAALRRVQERAREAADLVLDLCREQRTTPATLPPRSRDAYALLRWLADRSHVDAYVAQVRRALPILGGVEEWGGGLGDEVWGRPARVRFTLGRRVYRVRRRGDAVLWELSLGFLLADVEDLRALAACVALRRQAPEPLLRRYHELVEGEDFGAFVADVEMLADPSPYRPKGRVRDLDALFDRLDARFFRGTLARPNLHWAATASRRRFGFHVASRDLVCLNPRLDDPAVPEFVAEFVLYHELLHKKHGMRLSGGRRHAHTPAFAAEEALHPDRGEAERWLLRLAGHGLGDPGSGGDPRDSDEEGAEDPTEDLLAASRSRPVARPPSPTRGTRLAARGSAAVAGDDAARLLDEEPLGEPEPSPGAGDDRGGDVGGPGPAPLEVRRAPGRNDPCWCGSGRKYKRCHLAADEGRESP